MNNLDGDYLKPNVEPELAAVAANNKTSTQLQPVSVTVPGYYRQLSRQQFRMLQ